MTTGDERREAWQPMESAPKDGTTVILCGNAQRYGKPVQLGYWDDWRQAWSSFGPDGEVVAWQPLPTPLRSLLHADGGEKP